MRVAHKELENQDIPLKERAQLLIKLLQEQALNWGK